MVRSLVKRKATHYRPLHIQERAGDQDVERRWFAVGLAVVMAVMLALVPVLKSGAGVLLVLIFLTLLVFNAFREPERAFYVYVAWCWMDGTIRGCLGGSFILSLGRDLVLAFVLSGWATLRLRTRYKDPIRVPPATLPIILFAALCLIECFSPYQLGWLNNLGALKTHLSAIPLYFFAYDVFRRRGQLQSLALFLTLATAVIGACSLLQYEMGQSWTFAHFPGTNKVLDTTYNFVKGGAGNSFKPPGCTTYGGATGLFLALVVPVTFSLLLLALSRLRGTGSAIFYGCLLFADVIEIFINGLRIGITLAAVGAFICAFAAGGRMRARALGALATCGALAVLGFTISVNLSGGVLGQRYGSFLSNPVEAMHADRKTFFEQAIDLCVASPIGLGLGRHGAAAMFNSTLDDQDKINAGVYSESYIGFVIEETGIIGGIIILVIVGLIVYRAQQAIMTVTDTSDRLIAAGVFASLATMGLAMFAEAVLAQPPGSVLFWSLGGALIRIYLPPSPGVADKSRALPPIVR